MVVCLSSPLLLCCLFHSFCFASFILLYNLICPDGFFTLHGILLSSLFHCHSTEISPWAGWAVALVESSPGSSRAATSVLLGPHRAAGWPTDTQPQPGLGPELAPPHQQRDRQTPTGNTEAASLMFPWVLICWSSVCRLIDWLLDRYGGSGTTYSTLLQK